MKTLSLLCLAATALVTLPASAAGVYDGIYNVPNSAEYFSVHQNGGGMIVGNFITSNNSSVALTTAGGQPFQSTRMDYWNLLTGPLVGNKANLSGELVFGACLATATVVFQGGGKALFDITSATPTAVGAQQGINCAALLLSPSTRNVSVVQVF